MESYQEDEEPKEMSKEEEQGIMESEEIAEGGEGDIVLELEEEGDGKVDDVKDVSWRTVKRERTDYAEEIVIATQNARYYQLGRAGFDRILQNSAGRIGRGT